MDAKVVRRGEGRAVRVLDEVITFKAFAQETDQALFLFEDAVAREGGGPPPHIHHDQDEAFFVLEGQYAMRVGDRSWDAGPGDLVLAPRGIPHAFRLVGGNPGRLLTLVWPGKGLQDFFEEVGEPPDAPERPPDLERLLATARRYGIEVLPPG